MIGKIIKDLRAQKDITQETLGKAIGVTTSMIGMYETGARKPSFEVLNKIADYFGVSTDYLLGRNDLINQSTDNIPAGIYLRLAKEAEEMQLPEKDVQLILEMFKRFKKANE
ncbi:XRE family transcriptional regulator [Paradesulfitobacterium aromaticivorans]